MALATVLVVMATGCAGVFGTIVHDIKSQKYLEESRTRHSVLATATSDSVVGVLPDPTASMVNARWQADGAEHLAQIRSDRPVNVGESLQIWVDTHGNHVSEPTPVSVAGVDAVVAALLAWLTTAIAIVGIVVFLRIRTNEIRDRLWDSEIRLLADNDGGYDRS